MKMNSVQIYKKSREHFVGGVNSPVRAFGAVGGIPKVMTKGKGAYLTDADGKSYIDFVLSWGPLILGHAHPRVVKAIARTAEKGISFGAPTYEELALAELICDAFPSIEKLRFMTSGTEAAMTALRLARGFTRRKFIVKFSGCYHGHSDALLVSGGSGLATFGIASSAGVPEELAQLTLVAPYNDAPAFQKLMRKFGKQVAAVIVEPIAGNMGVVVPEEQFLIELRAETTRYRALLIFDEVITGFRLNWGGLQNRISMKPDLTCLGKIIGGGLPVGAVGGKKEIMEILAPVGHVYQAGTLSGNPVAMAAGRATLEVLKRTDPYEELEEATEALARDFTQLASEADVPLMINHIGSMFTTFVSTRPFHSFRDAESVETARYGKLFHALLEEGIYFPPSQFEACFLSTAHTESVLAQSRRAFERALTRSI